MFKNRSVQVKLVKDQETPAEPVTSVVIEPEKIVDSVVTGIAAIIIIHKAATLFCNTAEHLIVTKIK